MDELDRATEGLVLAEAQLADLDRRLSDLSVDREAVRAYVNVLRRKLGQPGIQKGRPSTLVPRTGAVPARRRARAPDREAKMRFYWEAVAIIKQHGKPMTAPRIHDVHPMKDRYGPVELYRAFYNRNKTTLGVYSGAFWPKGEPLPEGWTPPTRRTRRRTASMQDV